MNGFRKMFPSFLSHYATFFAKMAERKLVPFDEFQLKLMHLFQKHPVCNRTSAANSECHIFTHIYPHKFCLALRTDVFVICIEKGKFLL
jgi:hypothetical protein